MYVILQTVQYLIQSLWWSWLWFCILLDLSIDHGILVLTAWGCLVLRDSIQGVSRRCTIATKIEGARKIWLLTLFLETPSALCHLSLSILRVSKADKQLCIQ